MLRRRIPPASSSTIVGVSTLAGVAAGIGLRRLGCPQDAGLVVGAAQANIHPQAAPGVAAASRP